MDQLFVKRYNYVECQNFLNNKQIYITVEGITVDELCLLIYLSC